MANAKKTEIKGKVFETYDYDSFKTVKGNRVVNEKWIEKLAEKMSSSELDVPVMCGPDMKVIDGQHRIQARKKLGLPVRVYVMDEAKDTDVARINADRVNLKSIDYLNFWRTRTHANQKDYQLLKYLADHYNFGIELAIMVGAKQVARNWMLMADFKAGKYKIVDFKYAQDFGENYLKLIDLLGKPARARTFLNVFMIFYKHPDFEFDRFYHACKTNGAKILNASDRQTMIKALEWIYNFQLKGRKHKAIKFSRWIEDRDYVEVSEKEIERRKRGRNQYRKV